MFSEYLFIIAKTLNRGWVRGLVLSKYQWFKVFNKSLHGTGNQVPKATAYFGPRPPTNTL